MGLKVLKTATAGTLESSDIMISITPAEKNVIEIESAVGMVFGDTIRTCIEAKLAEMKVQGAKVFAQDKGARDCVINARMETALIRASKESA